MMAFLTLGRNGILSLDSPKAIDMGNLSEKFGINYLCSVSCYNLNFLVESKARLLLDPIKIFVQYQLI